MAESTSKRTVQQRGGVQIDSQLRSAIHRYFFFTMTIQSKARLENRRRGAEGHTFRALLVPKYCFLLTRTVGT